MKVDVNDFPNSGISIDRASKAVPQSLKKKFNTDFADWLASQNEHFEAHGLWCDGLVPWMSASFNGVVAD